MGIFGGTVCYFSEIQYRNVVSAVLLLSRQRVRPADFNQRYQTYIRMNAPFPPANVSLDP